MVDRGVFGAMQYVDERMTGPKVLGYLDTCFTLRWGIGSFIGSNFCSLTTSSLASFGFPLLLRCMWSVHYHYCIITPPTN